MIYPGLSTRLANHLPPESDAGDREASPARVRLLRKRPRGHTRLLQFADDQLHDNHCQIDARRRRPVPMDWRLIVDGYLPEYAYDRGAQDISIPLSQLRSAAHIAARARMRTVFRRIFAGHWPRRPVAAGRVVNLRRSVEQAKCLGGGWLIRPRHQTRFAQLGVPSFPGNAVWSQLLVL